MIILREKKERGWRLQLQYSIRTIIPYNSLYRDYSKTVSKSTTKFLYVLSHLSSVDKIDVSSTVQWYMMLPALIQSITLTKIGLRCDGLDYPIEWPSPFSTSKFCKCYLWNPWWLYPPRSWRRNWISHQCVPREPADTPQSQSPRLLQSYQMKLSRFYFLVD